MLGPSGHEDSFTRDNLPPPEAWPRIDLSGYDYPDWLNAGAELTDRMVDRGFGDRVALGVRRELGLAADAWLAEFARIDDARD